MSLPEISFAEENPAIIEQELIGGCESLLGKTLYPAEPLRLFLSSLAYRLAVQNAVINLAGRQGLLAFATGGHLDHLGSLLGEERLSASPSRVMVRYALKHALGFGVTIPSGSRVTTRDGGAVFATAEMAAIEAGSLHADVLAIAETAGAAANGLVPGQICEMVDVVAWIDSVSNVSTSTDGDEEESDEHFREKIRQAPEKFSVAGPEGAYRALMLAVSTEIEEVSVGSPTPGVVDIRFIMQGGTLPDEATIALAEQALSDETVRPLTDKVVVGAPDTVNYAISGHWYAAADDAAMLATITKDVEEAVTAYRMWQRGKPGRDINPSELIRRVMVAGAKRVELDAPTFQRLADTEVAIESSVTFSFGGVEDD
ncbi:MAG: baseplate J/gp47 family protein [Mailhella sp.]|nr:baseplate J/gp47 family protein [Mailhella sp.]